MNRFEQHNRDLEEEQGLQTVLSKLWQQTEQYYTKSKKRRVHSKLYPHEIQRKDE
jgi:hypothetical protein